MTVDHSPMPHQLAADRKGAPIPWRAAPDDNRITDTGRLESRSATARRFETGHLLNRALFASRPESEHQSPSEPRHNPDCTPLGLAIARPILAPTEAHWKCEFRAASSSGEGGAATGVQERFPTPSARNQPATMTWAVDDSTEQIKSGQNPPSTPKQTGNGQDHFTATNVDV